jgi:quinol monooxygenase YgiN
MGVIRLTGTLTCPPERLDAVHAALAEHIRLTRAEPGCEMFEVTETVTGVFAVSERFTDHAAFEAHQTRTQASDWAVVSAGLPRDFKQIEG